MATPGFTRRIGLLAFVLFISLYLAACSMNPGRLYIYFIDVEGGQATLVITPTGDTLLIDAGYPGKGKSNPTPGDPGEARDAQRIATAAADANVSEIDFLLVTHFHEDHFGGVMELAQLLPVGTIIDHGTEARESRSKPRTLDLISAYKETRKQINYRLPVVGDELPIEGAEVVVVSSAGNVLTSHLGGAGQANPACDRPPLVASDPHENPRSIGVLLRFGEFRFLDLGDLAGKPLSDLVCPANRIGVVDVYQIPHHGQADSVDPATFAAFRPRVAILNNGATKGGHPSIFELLRSTEGLEDAWQLHLSENEGSKNFPPEQIANLDTQTAHWIKLTAGRDGSFQVFNSRTGNWNNYDAE